MKKIIISFILVFIIWLITFFSLSFLKKDYIIARDDSLRHNKFAYNITKYWFIENDLNHNWWDVTAHSILEKYNVDLWQGHHLFLAWLLKLWVDINDLNKYYISIFLFLISFIILLLNFELKNSLSVWLWSIVLWLFLNPDIYYRILLSRPYLFTIILFLLVLTILYKKKYLWLFLVFLIWSIYHFLFLFLFFPLVVYILVYRLDLKNNLKIFWSSIIWSVIWVLIHTKSISYVVLSFISLFYVPILQIKFWYVVTELWTYNWLNLYVMIVFILLVFLYLFLIKKDEFKKILKQDKFFVFLNIYMVLLFILSIFILRFLDFFIIVYIFNILYLAKYLIDLENIKISKKVNIYGIIICLVIILMTQVTNILMENKNKTNDISETKTFLTNSNKYLEKWSIIASNEIYNFYTFYYYLWEDYKYLMSMEQIFIYLNDKSTFLKIFDTIYNYKFKPNYTKISLYKALKSLWVNYYFVMNKNNSYLVERSLDYEIEKILKDPNFELIYQYNKNYLWKLK